MVEGSQTSPTRRASTRESANGSTQTAESIEKKMASLSYSFSQNMPAPRKKKSPFERNFPELGASDKPAGLNLDSQNRLQSASKDSETRSSLRLNSAPAAGQKTAAERVSSTPIRSATAAEVVAYRRKPSSAPVPKPGRNSELELFSKLVPTTSAVPRSSKLSGVNSNLGKFPESSKNAQSNRVKPTNLKTNSTHSLGSGGMVVLGSNANDGRKGSGGLMKLRPTSSTTTSSSLRGSQKSERDVALEKKSEQQPTGPVSTSEISPEPVTLPPPQQSEAVVEPALDKTQSQDSNHGPAEESSFGVQSSFKYPMGSPFQFRDQVESLKRQQSSRAESVSFAPDPHFGDPFGSEGQKDDSAPVDMSAFSSSANSPLYMPSARSAGDESVPEGVEGDGDVDESVLPPLPNADDHHEFESVLRQMGWTPEEEDDDRSHGNQESGKQKWLRSFGASSSSARSSSGAREPHQLYIK
uniref:Uncharacterized protein n=1 Tax=Rhodosorus marinus TaxID=101924 RepID=A0A7S2ZGH2_9RHOD|mmetsp:Transcript_17528/g.70966  ORF Transcript_17528/g.70966 Transcript_17528/m.70966 type:complete len:469 (+) Transcript_17528:575-1981(+)|eukprot:CAMPEP_0113964036 /NCGR_PEP_ID=MMETSP0011_2-20120614/6878_1 /TAXON_ID=101924 /ORGANISM="Rhodosorus marinus" /LENGTH=468 /DNA_ID=CAMNT_0000976217 /DNA_START=481 /DNA_END=1887 /DNA_ORIENTATION=+ /assembly_acc=CAM_ASM_000156